MSLPTAAGVSLIGSSVFFLAIGAVSPASVSMQNSGYNFRLSQWLPLHVNDSVRTQRLKKY